MAPLAVVETRAPASGDARRIINMPAIVILLADRPRCSCIGIKESARVNNVIVIIKVAIVILRHRLRLHY